MEKINAVVKIAKESKVDSLHKNGIALEGIANTIEHSVKELNTADSVDNTFAIWYYRGLIDASLYAFQSVVVCSGLNDTPEGAAVLKIDPKEVKEDA